MAWQLKNATFRGVPFYVDTSSRLSGRALVAHDIPQSDQGEIWEDLGPDIVRFQIEAYLIGAVPGGVLEFNPALDPVLPRSAIADLRLPDPTLYTWRDRLLDALDRAGPGTLSHPTFGTMLARARVTNVVDSKDEQRFIRLSIEFVRDRQEGATVATPRASGPGEASKRSDELEAASGARVEGELETAGVAETARDATASELRKISTKLRSLDRFTKAGQDAADLARQASAIAQSAKALATAPATLVATVVTAVRDVERAVDDASHALAAYESLLELVPSVYRSSAEDSNAKLINGLVRGAAAGGALRAAVEVPWDSYEQAIAARDRLLARIDELELQASDTEYEALSATAASIVQLVPSDEDQLPRIGSFTPPATTPAIVLAWRLYADVDREAEIIARNRIRNPNFVTGGRALEVLVDAAR